MNQDIVNAIINQNYASITDKIEKFIENEIEKNQAKGIILGLSGGIDSAVLAYICKRNLKKKTLAIIMPDTTITPSIETEDAMKIISLTGIEHKLIDIKPIVNEYSMYLEPNEKARGNLRARVRTNILYYYANIKNYLVLGSSDKSEYLIGYFTKFGDGCADLLPISKLYKTQIREFAKMLGVPNNIITKKSSPNLWKEHIAEEELGITFEEIDSILYCLEKRLSVDEIVKKTEIKKDFVEKICQMHENSWHKRLPPKRVVQNMDEINKLISRMENDANI